jgi:sensor histidine kinase regulating citrate/malate metabolism
VRGLLALGAPEDALRFVEQLETAHHVAYGRISGAIENHVVAGLLLAETAIAQQRGITLEIDDASRLERLPRRLADADAVTIVGNLLENAFDAVAGLDPGRRRVRLAIVDDGATLTIRVADRGPGVAEEDRARLSRRGFSTKAGHAGVGLALVRDAIAVAGGTLEVSGSTFTASIPMP